MARDHQFQSTPLAEDYEVGDDSDMPGDDQPITQDDIDEILNSPNATVEERRAMLLELLDDIGTRRGMDETNEYYGLAGEIAAALAALDAAGDGIGTPGAYGFAPEDRAQSPDEILERQEEEARAPD